MNIWILVILAYIGTALEFPAYARTNLIMHKEDLEKLIRDTLKDAFGADHLYAQPLNGQNVRKWKDLVDDAGAYVNRYSFDDSVMMGIYRDIKRTNNHIIENIQTTYNTMKDVKPLSAYDRSRFSKNNNSIGDAKHSFLQAEKDMMETQDKVKAFNININEADKIKVRDMLILLGKSVELLAKKAATDVNKEL